MYVCLCKAVTKAEIIRIGDLKKIIKITKAGTVCGICIKDIKKIIQGKNDKTT